MGAQTRRWIGFRPSRCSSVAQTSIGMSGCLLASSASVSASFFKSLHLFGGCRVRIARTRRLDRPTDRLQRLTAALWRKLLEPKLIGQGRELAARPHAAVRRRLLEPNLQLLQKLGLEHRRQRAVVAAKIPECLRPQRVVAGLQLLNPARYKARQRRYLRNRMTLRQKPDRLVVPRRARILARAITPLQLPNAQISRNMRHGPPSHDSWSSNLTASPARRNPPSQSAGIRMTAAHAIILAQREALLAA